MDALDGAVSEFENLWIGKGMFMLYVLYTVQYSLFTADLQYSDSEPIRSESWDWLIELSGARVTREKGRKKVSLLVITRGGWRDLNIAIAQRKWMQ